MEKAKETKGKKKMKCSRCHYAFYPKGEQGIPRRCPYCAAEGTVSEARHILEEIY
jgi:predicted Zn-ribbon and HTH transcriptional regulator